MDFAPHSLTLRQLQYTVAVADCLSFRKASERCHVSQPSLSAQITQLEENLGVRLFERDRRQVLVTAAGRNILDRARRLLRETDDFEELARAAGDPLAISMHIGIIPTVSPYLLPRIGPAIRAEYPPLTIRWIEDKTNVLVRNLHAGALDAVVLAREAQIGDVGFETLVRDPFVLATSAGHPLSTKARPVRIQELRNVTVLIVDEEHCFGEQALAFCSDANAQVNEFRATSISTLVQMVACDAGVTLLPELAVSTEVKRANLHIRRFAKPEPGRTIGLAWRRKSPIAATLHRVAVSMRSAHDRSRSLEGSYPRGSERQPQPAALQRHAEGSAARRR